MKRIWNRYINPDTILFAVSLAVTLYLVAEFIKCSGVIYGRALTLTFAIIAAAMFDAWVWEGVRRTWKEFKDEEKMLG